MKTTSKKYFEQIYKDVLTREQMKARKAGKGDSED